MLNDTTSRALSHPAGGSAGQSDFNDSDTQPFKRSAAWGSHNILSWAASNLPPSEVEKKIGLILPPTLVLMDDWEPHWRLRGIRVLDSWMDKMDPVLMRRMGIDKLLRSSVIHTMGLHASPPLVGVLPVALKLIKRTTTGKELAEAFAEVVDKGIIQGWTYAPSGIEGRRVLISIAGDLELLCRELGVGMIRWIKVSMFEHMRLIIDCYSPSTGPLAVYTDQTRLTALSSQSQRSALCVADDTRHGENPEVARADIRCYR